MTLRSEVRFFGSVTSTNDEARRLIGEVPHPVWCIAEEQTKGVGRRGRDWVSPKGNLYASLLLPCGDPPDQKALRSFVAALALHDALAGKDTGARVSLKWPNDVLVNGAKVAGILLEAAEDHLIIGMGVNIASAPPSDAVEKRALRPEALNKLGFDLLPQTLGALLSDAFEERETVFRRLGFAPIRQAWLQRAARLGEPITARLAREEVTGVFETVDSEGALVLRTPTGPQHITAADIFFEDA